MGFDENPNDAARNQRRSLAAQKAGIALEIEKEWLDAEEAIELIPSEEDRDALAHSGECSYLGCLFDELGAVYRDGTIASYCRRCKRRLVIQPFAGSFTAKKVNALIADLMAKPMMEPDDILPLRHALEQLEDEAIEVSDTVALAKQAVGVAVARMAKSG